MCAHLTPRLPAADWACLKPPRLLLSHATLLLRCCRPEEVFGSLTFTINGSIFNYGWVGANLWVDGLPLSWLLCMPPLSWLTFGSTALRPVGTSSTCC